MRRIGLLGLLLFAALALRLPNLGATGLSEDEIDKLHAADAYDHGQFAVDGEHPALMKLAIYGSLKASALWNTRTPPRWHVSTEAAVRAPNAIAGALIVVVIFLLAEGFFGTTAGACAAAFWALDIGAIAINRIAKEDTFALLFMLLGALFYERAKRVGTLDHRRAQRWFALSGAAFGVMLASKYVPYLFGMHAIYFKLADREPGMNRPDKPAYLGALAGAFLIANFPVLDPGNWTTILTFLQERAIAHSGYLFQGQLWVNRLSATPWGLPLWFYAAQLLTKAPLPVLACALVGFGALLTNQFAERRGRVFVMTFFVLTFGLLSISATKFLRYLLPAMAMVDIAAGVGVAWMLTWALRSTLAVRLAAAAATASVFLTAVLASMQAEPLTGMYRNTLGRALSPHALWFPPDEFYDAGVREATRRLAAVLPHGATILTEAPNVVGFYALSAGRADLIIERPEPMDTFDARPGSWLVVQEGRRYFENERLVTTARRTTPVFAIDVGGFRAVEVYRAPHIVATR